MKKLHLICLTWLLIFLASCKSNYELRTLSENKVSIGLKPFNGDWNINFDKDKVFKEFLSLAKDTIQIINPQLYFKEPKPINKLNKSGQKTGIWITGNNKMFEICNYRKGNKHGKSIIYLAQNETIESTFKMGKLNGWHERKLADKTFYRKFYKNDIVRKVQILSPNW